MINLAGLLMELISPEIELQKIWNTRKQGHHWNYQIEKRLDGFYAVTIPHRWQNDTGEFLGKTFEEAAKTLRFYSE